MKAGRIFQPPFLTGKLKIENLKLENTPSHTSISFSILDQKHQLVDRVKNWKQVPNLNVGQMALVDNEFMRPLESQAELLQPGLNTQAQPQISNYRTEGAAQCCQLPPGGWCTFKSFQCCLCINRSSHLPACGYSPGALWSCGDTLARQLPRLLTHVESPRCKFIQALLSENIKMNRILKTWSSPSSF